MADLFVCADGQTNSSTQFLEATPFQHLKDGIYCELQTAMCESCPHQPNSESFKSSCLEWRLFCSPPGHWEWQAEVGESERATALPLLLW